MIPNGNLGSNEQNNRPLSFGSSLQLWVGEMVGLEAGGGGMVSSWIDNASASDPTLKNTGTLCIVCHQVWTHTNLTI